MKNREILFRTAHYDYEGKFYAFSYWVFLRHEFSSPSYISSCDPAKAVHEEFTGLTDKNGTKIFEGDIVKWDDRSNGNYWRIAEVKINPSIVFDCS